MKKNWNEDQIFEQQPSSDLYKVNCVHTEVLGFNLTVLLAFSLSKSAKNDNFWGKILLQSNFFFYKKHDIVYIAELTKGYKQGKK